MSDLRRLRVRLDMTLLVLTGQLYSRPTKQPTKINRKDDGLHIKYSYSHYPFWFVFEPKMKNKI